MKKLAIVALVACCMTLTSCDIFDSLVSQATSVANLANCDFSLKNVNNVSVAGINVKNVANGKLSATDVVKLVAAYQSKKVPLEMDVNVNVKNPTKQQAAMTALDWVLALDGTDIANGVSNKSYTIRPNATTTVALPVSTDLSEVFSSKGTEALKNFAQSFTSDGVSSKVGLRVKPRLSVGTVQVPFPNYIKLEKKTGNS